MLELFSDSPVWILFISLIGALITWFAADQFRDQLLADSHRLVREVALRYLQITIGLFAIFGVGVVISLLAMATNSLGRLASPTALPATETPLPSSTPDSGGFPPANTPTPTSPPPIPTATLDVPDSDPTLAEVRTATIGLTNGVGLNLRDAPGLETNVITIIPEGAVVTLEGETQFVDGLSWVKVIAPDGEQGWVADLFLTFNE